MLTSDAKNIITKRSINAAPKLMLMSHTKKYDTKNPIIDANINELFK